jgi:GH25 family lysozyme M1 (1,4-beta-N-acetylmuramidase)
MVGSLARIAVAAVTLAGTGAGSAVNVGSTHSPRTERLLAGGADHGQVRPPDPGDVLGIDVAAGQHADGAAIDWAKVAAAGYRFAFVKATEGSYYANHYFAEDVAAARAAGMLVAPYHFANPSYSSGTLQADFALNEAGLGDDGTTLPLILDLEYDPYSSNWCYGLTKRQLVAWIGAFTGEVYRRTGHDPVIYTIADWWAKCTGSSTAFASDPLWVASYDGQKTPELPVGWSNWTYWQYSSSGQVPGITGDTDLSELNPAALEVATSASQTTEQGQQPASVAIRSINPAAGQQLSYSATGLPADVAIDSATGVISGTATGPPGAYPVTVTVAGPGLAPVTDSFSWNVFQAPIEVTRLADQSGALGDPASLQVAASDSLPGCTLTFAASGLPPGLSIGPCGLISGWLDRAGAYHPVVKISDSSGELAVVTFSWVVRDPSEARPAGHLAAPQRDGCLGLSKGRLSLARCQPVKAERWTLTADGGLRLGGRCLAPRGTAGQVRLRACRDSVFQQWQSGADGALVSDQAGGCLTAITGKHGETVGLGQCLEAQTQRWTIPAGPLTSGVPGWCASSWHSPGTPASSVTLRRCGTARATAWTVEPSGTLRTSGGCLTLTYPAVPGAVVHVAACRGRPDQQWQPLSTGPLASFLVNPATGLCLADPGDRPDSARLAIGYCVFPDEGTSWRLG